MSLDVRTDVYLVVDLSGSMAGNREVTQRAMVADLRDTLAAAQRGGLGSYTVTVLGFSNRTVEWQYPIPERVIVDVLRTDMATMGGGTALLDAMGIALLRAGANPETPALTK